MSKLPSQTEMRETAGFVSNLLVQARLAWRLLRDSRVPAWVKLIPAAAVVYLISPIDILPDLALPGLGELDDLAILLLSAKALVDLSPADVVRQHLDQLTGKRRRASSDREAPRAGAETPSPDDAIDVPYRVIGAEDDGVRDG